MLLRTVSIFLETNFSVGEYSRQHSVLGFEFIPNYVFCVVFVLKAFLFAILAFDMSSCHHFQNCLTCFLSKKEWFYVS